MTLFLGIRFFLNALLFVLRFRCVLQPFSKTLQLIESLLQPFNVFHLDISFTFVPVNILTIWIIADENTGIGLLIKRSRQLLQGHLMTVLIHHRLFVVVPFVVPWEEHVFLLVRECRRFIISPELPWSSYLELDRSQSDRLQVTDISRAGFHPASYAGTTTSDDYRQVSNISRTLVGNNPGGGTGPNFDGGVALVNAKTHPYLRETKGPDKPHV